MNPKNFPSRKLTRQLKAQGKNLENYQTELEMARAVRTKKRGKGIPGGGRKEMKGR